MKIFVRAIIIMALFVTAAIASPLVSVDWVKQHMNDANLVILDIGKTHADYEKGHIPGALKIARHIDIENTYNYPPSKFITKEQFESLMEKLGISNDTTVVMYDNSFGLFSTRMFSIMELYGHDIDKLKVVNGGLVAWQKKGYPVSTETAKPKSKGNYKVSKTRDITVTWDEVYRNSIFNVKPIDLIDARPFPEFSGKNVRAIRPGFIPNAINITGSDAANNQDDHTFKKAEEIKAVLKSKNIKGDREIYTYCHSGDRASHMYFAIKYIAGIENVKIYDGSWIEWASLVALPVQQFK